ncbi:MAG: 30S ribosomal protein S6 [Armatimonadetes bacterium]|nr:30S ribosomal protein S6 [Armatimonadota bacterium]
MKKTQKYETMYIVRPEVSDADLSKVTQRFKSVVEDHGGTVSHAAKWDRRKLAYEIDGCKEGNYVLMSFEAPTDLPAELSRLLGIADEVIRHRTFKVED